MLFDPYAVLRVKRNATAAAITKAFRKRSLATHPDRGGDRQHFEDAKRAYHILGDATRRARYDATGQLDDAIDNTLSQVVAVLSNAFLAVMEGMVKAGAKPAEEDMAAHLGKYLKQRGEELAQQKSALVERRAFLVSSTERFQASEGENFLDALVRSHIEMMDNTIKRTDAELALNAKASAELKRFTFKHEKKVRAYTMGWPSSATSATSTYW